VPVAGELDADRLPDVMIAVREALYDLRYRWLGVRIGGADATMRGQWLLLLVSLAIVFACFFGIGRFYHAGTASSAGAPPAQAGTSGSAIPGGLSGGSPIAGAVPVSIAVKPRAQPTAQPEGESQPPVATTPQALGGEASAGEVAAPPVVAQQPETSPSPAPTQTATAPRKSQPTSSRRAARARPRKSQPGTGATFDTSE
jgi:hypothetical protein